MFNIIDLGLKKSFQGLDLPSRIKTNSFWQGRKCGICPFFNPSEDGENRVRILARDDGQCPKFQSWPWPHTIVKIL